MDRPKREVRPPQCYTPSAPSVPAPAPERRASTGCSGPVEGHDKLSGPSIGPGSLSLAHKRQCIGSRHRTWRFILPSLKSNLITNPTSSRVPPGTRVFLWRNACPVAGPIKLWSRHLSLIHCGGTRGYRVPPLDPRFSIRIHGSLAGPELSLIHI